MKRAFTALLFLFVLGTTGQAQTSIRVSQESAPGEGDFEANLLGTITVFDQSTLTVDEIYQLDTTIPGSYNGTLTPSLSNISQFFFVQTLDGLALFVIHDGPDSDGGSAQMSFSVFGDANGVDRILEDDPSDTLRPGTTNGPFSLHTSHWWIRGRTDGIVLSALEDEWSLEAAFSDVDGSIGDEFVGILEWVAKSADGSVLPLALELDRRILLEPTYEVDDTPEITFYLQAGTGNRPLNCNHPRNVVVVYVPTTPEFDTAVIDHTTVSFEGAVETHRVGRSREPRRHEKDYDRDGDTDLVFHFRLGETNLNCDSQEATLSGQLYDGREFSVTTGIYMEEGPRIIKIR
jgi:hypothetical protein